VTVHEEEVVFRWHYFSTNCTEAFRIFDFPNKNKINRKIKEKQHAVVLIQFKNVLRSAKLF